MKDGTKYICVCICVCFCVIVPVPNFVFLIQSDIGPWSVCPSFTPEKKKICCFTPNFQAICWKRFTGLQVSSTVMFEEHLVSIPESRFYRLVKLKKCSLTQTHRQGEKICLKETEPSWCKSCVLIFTRSSAVYFTVLIRSATHTPLTGFTSPLAAAVFTGSFQSLLSAPSHIPHFQLMLLRYLLYFSAK